MSVSDFVSPEGMNLFDALFCLKVNLREYPPSNTIIFEPVFLSMKGLCSTVFVQESCISTGRFDILYPVTFTILSSRGNFDLTHCIGTTITSILNNFI